MKQRNWPQEQSKTKHSRSQGSWSRLTIKGWLERSQRVASKAKSRDANARLATEQREINDKVRCGDSQLIRDLPSGLERASAADKESRSGRERIVVRIGNGRSSNGFRF
jgi:hypothetical protein